ncbi:MAG: ferritin-like domain-containing protein [Bryobacterales bacterium]
MQENWGYGKLSGDFVKKQSIGEMKHAEELIERILYLDGVPETGQPQPDEGRHGREKTQLENDLSSKSRPSASSIPRSRTLSRPADNGSRELFARILVDEEEHIDWLEAQLQAIDDMGLGSATCLGN